MELSLTLSQLLEASQGRVVNSEALPPGWQTAVKVTRPSSLAEADARSIAFFFSRSYEQELLGTQAGVLVTGEDFVGPLKASGLPLWRSAVVLACRDPYFAMARVSECFAPLLSSSHLGPPRRGPAEVHRLAVVDESAELSEGVRVGPHCTIEAGARIGVGAILYPGCYVGPGCEIGEATVLFPGVTLYERTKIGKRCRIHAGVTIGADGFGYAPRIEDGRVVDHQKIQHLGGVVIGDEVELGAGACVDRGTFSDTVIGSKVKIDNQAQVGHNVRIGRGAVICGLTGLAGSSRIGEFAYVGGLTGVGNQVKIGDRARVGALTTAYKDVPADGTLMGNPGRDFKDSFKVNVLLDRMLAERKRSLGRSRGKVK